MTQPEEKDRQELSGWGRGAVSAARVERVASREQLAKILEVHHSGGRSLLARGYGRSYGDAAQCRGGTLLDCTDLTQVYESNFETGVIRVGAGCSLESILRFITPKGWTLPVVPGTAHVSIGGAIAADVHGKNHHRDGAFANCVMSLCLNSGQGEIRIGPNEHPELFWATVGGLGLTGVILEATICLRRIETSSMTVDTWRATNLDGVMDALASADASHQYSVAWLDGVTRGASLGRGVVEGADHTKMDELSPTERNEALCLVSPRRRAIAYTPPINLVQPQVVQAFNSLWYRRAPRRQSGAVRPSSSFFFPLDVIDDWNRLYGQRGFLQYQFVVPFDREDVIARVLESLHQAKLTPTLCVLKRFGSADAAPLSFPMPGWTLAVDLALGSPTLAPALDRIDELVADAGGRVYLIKDGRLRMDLLETMYPRLSEWLNVRERSGAAKLFVSDLWRRADRSLGER